MAGKDRHELLQEKIADEYGEAERQGEHDKEAADRVVRYAKETLGYTTRGFEENIELMYELYLFAKYSK